MKTVGATWESDTGEHGTCDKAGWFCARPRTFRMSKLTHLAEAAVEQHRNKLGSEADLASFGGNVAWTRVRKLILKVLPNASTFHVFLAFLRA